MSFTIANAQSSRTSHLSSRRGSLSAPDPFAQTQSVKPPRGQASRLTITSVPSSSEGSSSGPSEQDLGSRARRRALSPTLDIFPSGGNAHASSESAKLHKTRMSFAHSSFSSGIQPASDPKSSRSPSSSSPGSSSSAKHYTRSNSSRPTSSFQPRQSSLSPQQIYKLAHSSLAVATIERSSSVSPQPLRRSSPLFYPPNDPNLSESSSQEVFSLPPASFTPLPESHYLPFFDRPSEASALLFSEANSHFLLLLKHTFPPHHHDSFESHDCSNPTEWSFRQLVSYITECSRSDSSDKIWVTNIRSCILARSEVIWERFKNVLGVPPELDGEESIDAEESCGEPGEKWREEADEGDERLCVELIYPTPSLSHHISVSETEDDGSGYGGHRNDMETIGESEEFDGDNVATAINTRSELSNLKDRSAAGSPAGNICALRVHTTMKPPPEFTAYSEPRVSPTTRKAHSFSEGNTNRAVSPFTVCDHNRSVSFSHGRRHSDIPLELEHVAGNPLFPTSFGSLSIGPTLPANNAIHTSLALAYLGSYDDHLSPNT